MANERFLTFYNGHKMPIIGYGTWRVSKNSQISIICIFVMDGRI